ncbi:MAG TPA: hypothetical protein VGQ85_06085 [Candidatus Limnocylindrales bacterium]|nr:hypothetical protein [Candidatus Limnocylindrales bacterium]
MFGLFKAKRGSSIVPMEAAAGAHVQADDEPELQAMAPAAAAAATLDAEALMPRWRRPSLLAARHGEPGRREVAERSAMRFSPDVAPTTAELRIVRYAVVPLLDRPDEVLGLHLIDLIAGDEVQVIETSSAYWEVVCADGERGFVHRTTLGLPSVIWREPEQHDVPNEANDVLSALLAARGLN